MLTINVNSDTFIRGHLPFSTLILSKISSTCSSDADFLALHAWTRAKNSDARYSSYREKEFMVKVP